eukprot:scaffold346_cov347-Pavlova_lutheri.AAC.47
MDGGPPPCIARRPLSSQQPYHTQHMSVAVRGSKEQIPLFTLRIFFTSNGIKYRPTSTVQRNDFDVEVSLNFFWTFHVLDWSLAHSLRQVAGNLMEYSELSTSRFLMPPLAAHLDPIALFAFETRAPLLAFHTSHCYASIIGVRSNQMPRSGIYKECLFISCMTQMHQRNRKVSGMQHFIAWKAKVRSESGGYDRKCRVCGRQ